MSECTAESGTCPDCIAACRRKPGWFRPGEAERAAELLGVSLEELFATKLGIDWWEADGTFPMTYVLAPAVTTMEPGGEYPSNPKGTCVFLEHGRCAIHAAKPHECASWWCGQRPADHRDERRSTVREWGEHQDFVTKLLGEEPMANFSGYGPMDWPFGITD